MWNVIVDTEVQFETSVLLKQGHITPASNCQCFPLFDATVEKHNVQDHSPF